MEKAFRAYWFRKKRSAPRYPRLPQYSIWCCFPLARQSFLAFIQSLKPKLILLPEYCPEGLFHPVGLSKIAVQYYSVPQDLCLQEENFKSLLSETQTPPSQILVIYIHFFGIHLPQNDKLMMHLRKTGLMVLEDLAHTLPLPSRSYVGQILLCSYAKLLGIRACSPLFVHQEFKAPSVVLHKRNHRKEGLTPRITEKIFHALIQLNLILETLLNFFSLQSLPFKLLLKLKQFFYYYSFMLKHYPEWSQETAHPFSKGIKSPPLWNVTSEGLERFLQKIQPQFLWSQDPKHYLSQPLLALPLRHSQPLLVLKRLQKLGVLGYYLQDRWWPPASGTLLLHSPSTLYRQHLLVPILRNSSTKQWESYGEICNLALKGESADEKKN